ncbi:hypothetical protein [Halovivax sp.]|uniref:hypothetical protein n=1 Tax=Halovivax sp. TaxID=1935978 RepID=UPI0025BBC6CE|nr:hypothetical protein [Halovivax sp.]
MDVHAAVAEATLLERVVLLGVIDRADGSVRPDEVRSTCNERFTVETGRLSEADVSRALNVLEANGVLECHREKNPSPVGKGRPSYELAVDADDALAELEKYEGISSLASSIRE